MNSHAEKRLNILSDDLHFLSARNPTATVDQREMEALGLLLKAPVIIQARDAAARRWKMMCTHEVPGARQAFKRYQDYFNVPVK